MTQREENLKYYNDMPSDPEIRPAANSTIKHCVFMHGRLACPNTGELCPVVRITDDPVLCHTCNKWTSYLDADDPARGYCSVHAERRDGDEPICAEYTPL